MQPVRMRFFVLDETCKELWMMIWGQVHFWLRVEMVVKKNLMIVVVVVVVVVVTFLQDPCALNQCYRTWMVTCRCWCMSDVATQLLFGDLWGVVISLSWSEKKAERQPL